MITTTTWPRRSCRRESGSPTTVCAWRFPEFELNRVTITQRMNQNRFANHRWPTLHQDRGHDKPHSLSLEAAPNYTTQSRPTLAGLALGLGLRLGLAVPRL